MSTLLGRIIKLYRISSKPYVEWPQRNRLKPLAVVVVESKLAHSLKQFIQQLQGYWNPFKKFKYQERDNLYLEVLKLVWVNLKLNWYDLGRPSIEVRPFFTPNIDTRELERCLRKEIAVIAVERIHWHC